MENKNKIIDFLLAIFIVIGLSQSCNNKTKVINTFDKLIENGEFPCYLLADSLHGINSRGTDSWYETAYCNGEAIQYDNTGRRIYDYER